MFLLIHLIGQNNTSLNFSSAQIFVTSENFLHLGPTLFGSIKYVIFDLKKSDLKCSLNSSVRKKLPTKISRFLKFFLQKSPGLWHDKVGRSADVLRFYDQIHLLTDIFWFTEICLKSTGKPGAIKQRQPPEVFYKKAVL